jgi:hypothetical protein
LRSSKPDDAVRVPKARQTRQFDPIEVASSRNQRSLEAGSRLLSTLVFAENPRPNISRRKSYQMELFPPELSAKIAEISPKTFSKDEFPAKIPVKRL